MGLNRHRSSCSSSPYAAPNSNPDPTKFEILEERAVNGYLILLVKYPNCTNYEGKKLMVFKGYKASWHLLQDTKGQLDPHFSRERWSPVARFKPDTSMRVVEQMCYNL